MYSLNSYERKEALTIREGMNIYSSRLVVKLFG